MVTGISKDEVEKYNNNFVNIIKDKFNINKVDYFYLEDYKWNWDGSRTQDELLNKCFEITGKLATKSPTAIKTAIKVINAGYNTKLNGFEVEIEEFGKSFGTKDFKEGVGAFLEKRKANFKGE